MTPTVHDCWCGVLTFVKSPNFEKPADATRARTTHTMIMVEATDGTGHVGRKAVKVEVTNVDEDGTVELSALQPASRRCCSPLPLQIIDNGPDRLDRQRRVAVVQVYGANPAAGPTSTRPRGALTHPMWMVETLVTTCGRRPSTRTNRVLVAPITTRRHPWYRLTRC